jgi:hypothetical protein
VHPQAGLVGEKLERTREVLGRMVDDERDAEWSTSHSGGATVPAAQDIRGHWPDDPILDTAAPVGCYKRSYCSG